MTKNLTQKERMLLEDQLAHEEICIEKYSSYAQKASDPEVKEMFNRLAGKEQEHHDTISNLLGQKPTEISQSIPGDPVQRAHHRSGGSFMQDPRVTMGGTAPTDQSTGLSRSSILTDQEIGTLSASDKEGTEGDKCMLQDMLMTEKYISGTYDTAVFESVDPQVRQELQRIQQEEQEHGKEIFNYMHHHGMYQPK